MLICPLCHQPLCASNHQWRCSNNHCFDQAKEGYLNLLPVQHKGSKEPGDSPEMMQSRRLFLEAGYYDLLLEGLAAQLGSPDSLLDIGCGEGYYTHHLAQLATGQCFGIDISKRAVKMAAKRYPDAQFLVASNKRLPFADASLTAITRIFAPSDEQELARCTKPGGKLIIVMPGPRHLYQLKAQIYSDVRLHEDQPQSLEHFELENSNRITSQIKPDCPSLAALMKMTPFTWRLNEAARDKLIEQNPVIEIAFTLHQYRRI